MVLPQKRFLQLGPLALDAKRLHPVSIGISLSSVQVRSALPSGPDIRGAILMVSKKDDSPHLAGTRPLSSLFP